MSQVKVYGIDAHLLPIREALSRVIHDCLMEALGLPEDKRFHRFFPMGPADMLYPEGRTEAYTIIEISMIEGRTVASRKRLVRLLSDRIEAAKLGIGQQDLEICISEMPACNWGFRGMHGDDVELSYKINL